MEDRLVRVGEACRLLGIHRITGYRWIRKGILPAIRLPTGEFRIYESDIEILLLSGRLRSRTPIDRRDSSS